MRKLDNKVIRWFAVQGHLKVQASHKAWFELQDFGDAFDEYLKTGKIPSTVRPLWREYLARLRLEKCIGDAQVEHLRKLAKRKGNCPSVRCRPHRASCSATSSTSANTSGAAGRPG